jgi:4-hydroxy-tetrahydrodipicolinate reductase
MKVGVCGAGGKMGREVCRAVCGDGELELVCAVDPSYAGRKVDGLVVGISSDVTVDESVEAMPEKGVEVAVDFTVADAARKNVLYLLEKGIPCVVGTTGLDQDDLDRFDETARGREVGCLVAPNFAVGAVLMMEFARKAARYMDGCEIIELHHPAKLDAPSGTAVCTAGIVLEEWGSDGGEPGDEGPRGRNMSGVHIHSVRLPGLVAHQEIIFGGAGQTLTIRHDSMDRSSFMPGVIMGIKKVKGLRGVVVGLEKLMDL